MDEKKNYVIEEDEINLIDLLKIIYKWRILIFLTVIIILFISFLYVYTAKPKYESISIIKVGSFNDKILEDDSTINNYIRTYKTIEKVKNIFGEKTLFSILGIDFSKYLKLNDLEQKGLILNKWRKNISFSDGKLITKFYVKKDIDKINIFLANYIKKHQDKIVEKEKNNYIAIFNMILNEVFKSGKNRNISIGSINIPQIIPTEIVVKASDDTIQVIKPSLKKYLIIGLFIGLFIGLILPFILEFFKNLNWKEIKEQE